ncbi:MAG TPA: type II secretion system secretin GspD, partial [Xanthobacteraceae bacterium]|nr:type II secretion system secretin GspD [Xanthobacteraceae bacterium]
MWVLRPLRGGSLAVFCALIAAWLSACNQIPYQDEPRTPDVFDKIRSIDLLPRFPQQGGSGGQNNGPVARPQVYGGVVVPAIEPRPQATPNGEGGEGYELNFENTPIGSVAKVVLGDILGTGFIVDPRVQGTISLSSGRPIPKSDLLFVLENALRLSGVVLVRDPTGYRLVPLGDAVGGGNLDSAAARAEPGYGISVVPLQNVSAATLIKLLDSFATKPGTVRADVARNMLLIQGSGAERRSAIETVLSFDVDWMRGQSVGIFPVQYSAPEPIIAELEKILDSGEGGLSQNVVKFQVVARQNAILVVSRKPEQLRQAGLWIKRLDATDTTRTGVHVYRVQYGEARQLARVLTDAFVGGGGSGGLDTPGAQLGPGTGGATTTSTDRTSTGGQSGTGGTGGFGSGSSSSSRSGGGGGIGGAGGFGGTQSTLGTATATASGGAGNQLDVRVSALGGGGGQGQPVLEGVRITADVSTNSLLVFASTDKYRIIEQTLRQLDQPQLQVAIDATVAEVTLNDNLSYGVQFFIQSQNLGMAPDRGSALNVPASPPGAPPTIVNGVAGAFLNRAFPGFNLLIGSEANPHMILDALHGVTTVKVLSNPSLVVINNQLATLTVGDEIPVSTGTGNVLNAATGTSNTIINSIDYRNTGIILRVVPRVSVNGSVRLDIEQEISQVASGSGSTLTPTVSQRKVKSAVSVASGQTVLLAGLIQERSELDRAGIPVLDQIPKLGDIFSHQTRAITRTELIIFIRPQVIRDSVDAHFVAEELRTKLRGTIESVPSNFKPPPKL